MLAFFCSSSCAKCYLLHEHDNLRSLHGPTISRDGNHFLNFVLSKNQALIFSFEEGMHVENISSSLDLVVSKFAHASICLCKLDQQLSDDTRKRYGLWITHSRADLCSCTNVVIQDIGIRSRPRWLQASKRIPSSTSNSGRWLLACPVHDRMQDLRRNRPWCQRQSTVERVSISRASRKRTFFVLPTICHCITKAPRIRGGVHSAA